jgi:hypothetical protein
LYQKILKIHLEKQIGGISLYIGRDMTELTMLPKRQWKEPELAYFHHAFQQVVPYLNVEGQSLHRQIIEEIEDRGGLHTSEATYTQGTRVNYD